MERVAEDPGKVEDDLECVAEDPGKVEDDLEEDSKEKAKQRRSRTNFR